MTTPNRYDPAAARRMLMSRPGPGKTMPKEIRVDESWTLSSAPSKELDRLIRRERSVRPPADLQGGEAYRAWLLERVDVIAASDATDEERNETAAWRVRITDATTQELWSEYLDQPHDLARQAPTGSMVQTIADFDTPR
ncbi:hypothetical protein [Microbacterium aurantiacum]|uniref:hypothetical protein n=1 Tax=Microbacterium aurantiacum TaxID=162393 RepID=UPI000C803C12|nr:hypothetical protein [Microbacterium aurantiacum]